MQNCTRTTFAVVLGLLGSTDLIAEQRISNPPEPRDLEVSPGIEVLDSPLHDADIVPPDVIVRSIPSGLPRPILAAGFGIPVGLKTDPQILFPSLGYGPSHCFPLTSVTCFEVGLKCYRRGLFSDALAFVNHGLKINNHARLYLLKAVCEMHLGRCDEASNALTNYRFAASLPRETIGLEAAREQINDPMRVRLEELLTAPISIEPVNYAPVLRIR